MYSYKILNIRAIAILSVIIGHSIIIYSNHWNIMPTQTECQAFHYLHAFVDLYQMPLFFFISGFLFSKRVEKYSLRSLATNKFKRLLIPYFCIGLLWMIPLKTILGCPMYAGMPINTIIIKFIIGQENGHLWFLYCLFSIFIVFFLVYRLLKRCKWKNEIILLISFIVSIANIPMPFGVARFGFWFCLGFYFCQPQAYKVQMTISIFGVSAFTALVLFLFDFQGAEMRTIKFILSLILTLGLYHLIPNTSNNIISQIDKHSFGLYLFHSPLIYITYTYMPNFPPTAVFAINFILGGSIAFIMSHIIAKSRLSFMLGK